MQFDPSVKLEDRMKRRDAEREKMKSMRTAALSALRSGEPARPDATELVERVGKLQVFFQTHAHEWTDEECAARREKLLTRHAELDATLGFGGKIEPFGWTTGPGGVWHRVGDPCPAPVLSDIAIAVKATIEAVAGRCAGSAGATEVSWAEAEAAINEAAAGGDLSEVLAACEAYETFAKEQLTGAGEAV